jgi:tetratricopeptide (TPR) repeat protein
LRLKPGYLEPLVALSVLAELRKDYAQALYYYNKVIAVSGEYSMAIHLKLGRLYAQLKNIERSQKEYQWVLERDPHETRAYQGLAELYIANDKKDEAVKALNRSLIYDDKDPYTFLLLGIAYLDEKEYNKAIDYFKKASQADAEYEPAYFYLGSSYERIGKHQEAKNYLKKAIELNPKDADALNYLGYMYAEDNEQLDEAERLIKRALALEPKNGAFIDSLGWVYYKKGDLIRAKILIETALKLIGDDEVIYEHLGDVYDKLGEGLKAKKAWRKSLELKK